MTQLLLGGLVWLMLGAAVSIPTIALLASSPFPF